MRVSLAMENWRFAMDCSEKSCWKGEEIPKVNFSRRNIVCLISGSFHWKKFFMWSADVVVVNGSSHTCFNKPDRLPKCWFYNRFVARVYFDFHHISRANEPDRIFRMIRALCVLFAWERRALSPRCEMLYAKSGGRKTVSGKSDPRMACDELRAENVSEFRSVVRSLSSCLNSLFRLQFPVILLVLFFFGLCEGILIENSCGKSGQERPSRVRMKENRWNLKSVLIN